MLEEIPTIAVIDDDDSLRRALARLLTASGYQVQTFASATEFLAERVPVEADPGCLLIAVRMPGRNGLQLQAVLNSAGAQSAVVFMTGHGDVQTGVKAMKSGAVDFLLKPFTDDELLEAVGRALSRNAETRVEHREVDEREDREGASVEGDGEDGSGIAGGARSYRGAPEPFAHGHQLEPDTAAGAP